MCKAYVYGSEVQILDYHLARLHGTPYCKVFRNWAFMKPDEELKELAAEICATKMFKTRKQLDMASISLFEESMVSLNPVVNHLVHMK